MSYVPRNEIIEQERPKLRRKAQDFQTREDDSVRHIIFLYDASM